jgi:hypothetical protein
VTDCPTSLPIALLDIGSYGLPPFPCATRAHSLLASDQESRYAVPRMKPFERVLCGVVVVVSWIVFTFVYTWAIAWPKTKTVDPTVLLVDPTVLLASPVYWLLLILIIAGEVWFWRRIVKQSSMDDLP